MGSKGEILRMAPSCEKIVCPMGEQATLLEGHCCPTCIPATCIHEGRLIPSGSVVEISSCEKCVCKSGELSCEEETCPQLSCPPDQSPQQVGGKCCKSCVSNTGISSFILHECLFS